MKISSTGRKPVLIGLFAAMAVAVNFATGLTAQAAEAKYGKPGDPIELTVGHPCCYTEVWSIMVLRGKDLWKKYLPAGSTVKYEIGLQGSTIVNSMLARKQVADARARERQAAHRHGLALRADGVGEIHDARHEERHRDVRGERRLEPGHRQGRHRGPAEAGEQPRQAVAHAAHRRVLDRVARLRGLALDAGEHVQVLDVLAAQHLHDRLRGHHAEHAAFGVHHGQRVGAVVQRERGGALLVGVGAHAREVALERLVDRLCGRQRDDACERRGTEQAPVRVRREHELEARRPFLGEAREHIAGALIGPRAQHRGDEVAAYGLVVLHADFLAR